MHQQEVRLVYLIGLRDTDKDLSISLSVRAGNVPLPDINCLRSSMRYGRTENAL
jgi:hypothetical protein